MTILPSKDHAEGFLMVETGRAAAYVMDDVLIAGLVANSRAPGDYKFGDEALSLPEPYGIMLRKDDAPFKALADKATAALYKSPEGAALYDKWFMKPVPPKGVTLNMPMSDAMKKNFANPSDSPDPKAY
jgi:glutamate/aspartate transport system substrate-binding protein